MKPATSDTIPFRLIGQVAVITGGGTGLGLGIARCMAAAGARVVLLGRRETVLKAAAAEIGDAATFRVHDVKDEAATPALIKDISAVEGAPDILVHNAGNQYKNPSLEADGAQFRDTMDTHLIGPMALTRATAAGMIARGRGSILFVTSMAAVFGLPRVAAYAAAKSAMLGVVRALAVEWSPLGVRVNAIAPGWIETDLMKKSIDADPERRRRVLERTPMGRFGEAEDVGWAAVYLCSNAARFVTGHQLVVDGGVAVGF